MNNRQKGFSLTEISVTLVIVSLIVTSAMKGKDMIEKAKLRAIIAQVDSFKVSINSFTSKYDEFPGDFDNAESFWGTYASPGNTAGTQNGNNDGQIDFKNSSSVYEGYRAWQHLTYAKMIDVPFAGSQTTSAASLDTDVPSTKDKRGGYFFSYQGLSISNSNTITAGAPVAIAGSTLTANGIMTPDNAYEIDSKVDDGVPTNGSVRGADGNASVAKSCVDDAGTVAKNDDFYKLSASGRDCIIAFRVSTQ